MVKELVNYLLNLKIEDIRSRSIVFSNVIFLSLPIVYLIFIFIDYETYQSPFEDLNWDQFIVPLFIVLCLFCVYLNYIGRTLFSRLLFLFSWPMSLHLIPIISQNSPTDYYIAFPIGIIFHGVLIQITMNRKETPALFWLLVTINFIMLLFFKQFLIHFDADTTEDVSGLTGTKYYLLDVILYWLLFNLVVFYILQVIDKSINHLTKGKRLIEEKNHQIINALNQLKKTQNSLIQKEKLASIGVLSSGVVHEINNPINIIAGNIDLIKQRIEEKDLDKEDASHKVKEAKKALSRIRKVLDRVRLMAPEGDKVINIDLHEIIDNVLYLHKVYEMEELELTYSPMQVKLQCNPNKLHRVLSTILENALFELHETTSPKKLKIEVSKKREKINIRISNNGPKIPEEIISQIYDPFFTTKDTGDGVGLGLYIAYQIINEQNGTIHLDQSDGWVNFDIELPCSKII